MKITNFNHDWVDGKALCCFIDSFKPGLIINWNSFDPNKAITACDEALDIAEKEFKIPKIIKGCEITNVNIPEQIIMTYLSQFYNLKHENGSAIRETAKNLFIEDRLNFVLSGLLFF